jgi:hypothetical protein
MDQDSLPAWMVVKTKPVQPTEKPPGVSPVVPPSYAEATIYDAEAAYIDELDSHPEYDDMANTLREIRPTLPGPRGECPGSTLVTLATASNGRVYPTCGTRGTTGATTTDDAPRLAYKLMQTAESAKRRIEGLFHDQTIKIAIGSDAQTREVFENEVSAFMAMHTLIVAQIEECRVVHDTIADDLTPEHTRLELIKGGCGQFGVSVTAANRMYMFQTAKINRLVESIHDLGRVATAGADRSWSAWLRDWYDYIVRTISSLSARLYAAIGPFVGTYLFSTVPLIAYYVVSYGIGPLVTGLHVFGNGSSLATVFTEVVRAACPLFSSVGAQLVLGKAMSNYLIKMAPGTTIYAFVQKVWGLMRYFTHWPNVAHYVRLAGEKTTTFLGWNTFANQERVQEIDYLLNPRSSISSSERIALEKERDALTTSPPAPIDTNTDAKVEFGSDLFGRVLPILLMAGTTALGSLASGWLEGGCQGVAGAGSVVTGGGRLAGSLVKVAGTAIGAGGSIAGGVMEKGGVALDAFSDQMARVGASPTGVAPLASQLNGVTQGMSGTLSVLIQAVGQFAVDVAALAASGTASLVSGLAALLTPNVVGGLVVVVLLGLCAKDWFLRPSHTVATDQFVDDKPIDPREFFSLHSTLSPQTLDATVFHYLAAAGTPVLESVRVIELRRKRRQEYIDKVRAFRAAFPVRDTHHM